MMLNYDYLKVYICATIRVYRLFNLIGTLESLIYYLDYFPKEEIPDEYENYDLSIKECKKLIRMCKKRIKMIESRVD